MPDILQQLKNIPVKSFCTFNTYHLILFFANKIPLLTFPSLSSLQSQKKKDLHRFILESSS